MKHLILSLLVVGMLAAVASADYVNPPGWDGEQYFTHQSWTFDQPPGDPLSQPPEVDNNPYGYPIVTQYAGGWMDWILDRDYTEPSGDRTGGMYFEGQFDPQPAFDVWIPNIPDPTLHKEVWLQFVLVVGFDPYKWPNPADAFDAIDIDAGIFDPDGRELETVEEETLLYYDQGVLWKPDQTGYYGPAMGILYTAKVTTFPYHQPPYVVGSVLMGMPDGVILVIDEFDVDTRCIPEPSTIAMLLGLATMGLVAFIRRRK